jgi:hypothetical protein
MPSWNPCSLYLAGLIEPSLFHISSKFSGRIPSTFLICMMHACPSHPFPLPPQMFPLNVIHLVTLPLHLPLSFRSSRPLSPFSSICGTSFLTLLSPKIFGGSPSFLCNRFHCDLCCLTDWSSLRTMLILSSDGPLQQCA